MQPSPSPHRHAESLPSLGGRGEGWFACQVLLMAIVGASGLLGPAWAGSGRLLSTLAGAGVLALGAVIGVRAIVDLRASFTPLPRPRDDGVLVRHGVYAVVRHPMYLAVAMGALGWSLATASLAGLAATAVLVVFFDLKSRREEVWLVEAYRGYDTYRRRTRRLLPGIY